MNIHKGRSGSNLNTHNYDKNQQIKQKSSKIMLPLNILLQQAADLKTEQLKSARRRYDQYDIWLQNSLFAEMDVIDVRGRRQLSESLSFANDRRNRGNRAMSSSEYDLAIIEYEKCLSIFEWVEPRDGTENWKKKGIDDDNLRIVTLEVPENKPEITAQIRVIIRSCILNLSLCYLKTSQWKFCIAACSKILTDHSESDIAAIKRSTEDDLNTQKALAKAFYRRAKARLIPIISSYNDEEDYRLALQDLKSAAFLEQNDPMIRKEIATVKETLRRRRQQEDAAFKKALPDLLADQNLHGKDHGVAAAVKEPKEVTSMTYQDAQSLLRSLQTKLESVQFADRDHDGDDKDRDNQVTELSDGIATIKNCLNHQPPSSSSRPSSSTGTEVGIDCPTSPAELIKKTRNTYGLDLTDKRTQRLLNIIQDEHNKGSSESISREEIVSRACLRLQSEEATEIATHIVTQLTADADADVVPDKFGQSQAHMICQILIDNRHRALFETRRDTAAMSLREQLINYMRDDVIEFFQSRNSAAGSTSTSTTIPTFATEGETLFELLAQKYDFESLNMGLSVRRRAWLSRKDGVIWLIVLFVVAAVATTRLYAIYLAEQWEE